MSEITLLEQMHVVFEGGRAITDIRKQVLAGKHVEVSTLVMIELKRAIQEAQTPAEMAALSTFACDLANAIEDLTRKGNTRKNDTEED